MTESLDLNDPEFIARLATVRQHSGASPDTHAYVHRGMWVADCMYPECNNAQRLEPGQLSMQCIECHWSMSVTWPKDAQDIDTVLRLRPVPGTRHWAPAGHRQAIACGFAQGQTVADLLAENETHMGAH